VSYERLKRIPEASAVVKKLFLMRAQLPQVRVNVAAFFMRHQRYDDAVDAFQQVLKKHPRDLEARKELIRFYFLAKRGQEADSVVADLPRETADDWMLRVRVALIVADEHAKAGKMSPDAKLKRLKALIAEGRTGADKNHELASDFFDALENWVTRPQQWLVVGPFPGGPDFKGFDSIFPPEKSLDLRAEYQGARGPIRWQPAGAMAGDYVDLIKLCGTTPHVVAYAFTQIHSTKEQEVTLRIGSDDAVKVWLNDRTVLESRVYRPFRAAEDTVRVVLRPGPNKLLLKIDQGLQDWGFAVEAVDSRGWPADVRWETAGD
jgi:tetratricopeptide repeat protein